MTKFKAILIVFPALVSFFVSTSSVSAAQNTITANVAGTSATFSGFAAPKALVTIKEGGSVIGTVQASSAGTFSKKIVSDPGLHTFSLYQTDSAGRATPLTTIKDVSLANHFDTPVSNIHLPPTIALSRSSLTSGESVTVSGQGAPGSTVNLFLNGTRVYNAKIGASGKWQFVITSGYKIGSNSVYANLSRVGLSDSVNSQGLSFEVKKACSGSACPSSGGGSTSSPEVNFKADIKVNLTIDKQISFLFLLIFVIIITLLILLLVVFLVLAFGFLSQGKTRRNRFEETLENLEARLETDVRNNQPLERLREDFQKAEEEL
ncbi:MAG: hypothetical protein Q8P13_01385 [bacterium]|nr:hypothetical protein [bacterium]